MSGSDRKKTKKSRSAIQEICGQVKKLLNGFTDEELAWLMFDIDNPQPSEREMEEARQSIEGSRLRKRQWTITKLADAAFDFGITDEPPHELARWLEDKESVRAFLLEHRL
jgi:hypothetical protein